MYKGRGRKNGNQFNKRNYVVSKVIVGGYNEDGTVDPYKITFVLKGMEKACITDAKNRMKKVVGNV